MSQSVSAEWAVNQMVVAGREFSDIEDFINELTLSSAQKTVLWLWAWAEQPAILRHTLIPLDREDSDGTTLAHPPRPLERTPALPAIGHPSDEGRGGLFRILTRKKRD